MIPESPSEGLRQATDPTTGPATLLGLFQHYRYRPGWAAVHRAIAAHPNTPPEALTELAADFPAAVCANPVLSLLPLERPEFLNGLDEKTALRLLSCASLPFAIARLLADHPADRVQQVAHRHITVTGEVDEDTLEEWNLVLRTERETLPLTEDIARNWGREVLALGLAPEWFCARFDAKGILREKPYRSTSAYLWESAWVVDSSVLDIVRKKLTPLIRERSVPEALLRSIEEMEWKPITGLCAIARLPEADADTLSFVLDCLEILQTHATPNRTTVFTATASVQAQTRIRRGRTQDDVLTLIVAAHPNVTPPLLRRITANRESISNATLHVTAENPRCPPDVLKRLANADIVTRDGVRRSSYRNDPAVRLALLHGAARDALSLCGKAEGRLVGWVFVRYAPVLPFSDFLTFARHPEPFVRAAVALNPATPLSLRRRLVATEGDRYVRAAARDRLRWPDRDFGT